MPLMYLYLCYPDMHVERFKIKRFSDLSQKKSRFYYYEEFYDDRGHGKTVLRDDILCFELSPYPIPSLEEAVGGCING